MQAVAYKSSDLSVSLPEMCNMSFEQVPPQVQSEDALRIYDLSNKLLPSHCDLLPYQRFKQCRLTRLAMWTQQLKKAVLCILLKQNYSTNYRLTMT